MVRAILLEVCREVLPRERMTRTKRSLPRKPSAFPAASGSTPTSSLAGRQPLSGLKAGRTPCSIRSLEARAVSTATPTRPTQRILTRSEEHTSELQSHSDLVCRLLLEKKKQTATI